MQDSAPTTSEMTELAVNLTLPSRHKGLCESVLNLAATFSFQFHPQFYVHLCVV